MIKLNKRVVVLHVLAEVRVDTVSVVIIRLQRSVMTEYNACTRGAHIYWI